MATILEKANQILNEKTTKILSENIKSGVQIFDVEGIVTELKGQEKIVTPSTTEQIVTPDTDYNGLTSVTISAVDNSIDSNILAENIKAGVTILGVTGTYTGETTDTTDTTTEKTIT